MATIDELKSQIDLHDLADKLGLERPGGSGNYRSPNHKDKNPSLSIFASGARWKDHSSDEGGSCIDLVRYVEGCDTREAIKRLHEIYGLPLDPPKQVAPRQKSLPEKIAEIALSQAEKARDYLVGRGIDAGVIDLAIAKGSLGFNSWTSTKVEAGQFGYGGDAAAFIVRTLNPGHVAAVDMRYIEPELNGGVKTQCQGEKRGHPYFIDHHRLKSAETVYVVESPINVLSVESCKLVKTAAVATRGVNALEHVDWRFLAGKRVVLCMDNDAPDDRNRSPGREAAWRLQELLTAQNIAALLVDQDGWEENDVNDILRQRGVDELRMALRRFEQWMIPGLPGQADLIRGRSRVFLPSQDYAQYWRYRLKEDFTSFISKRTEDDEGNEKLVFADLCGFRVASISRVSVAGATATMTGELDTQPRTLYAVSIQAPRHGLQLQRRVFEDEQLHNADQWRKFGPVYAPAPFLRMINILERTVHLGERKAVNFVGLAWRDGKPIVNEGPDCYFTDPDKQCPYHNLMFPSGRTHDARAVIDAYQATFGRNAAAMVLAWALGGHLKAFLGFWPHMIMQADKGAGKSTLIKRLERTIAFTMFSGQSLQTEFRLLTSVSHTSHPVGWEEISARRQDMIDRAVGLLQEAYNYSPTRRGSEMTAYLVSAPVLLAGEDVPMRSLLGKVVRAELTGRKGALIPDDLPRFPLLQWLKFLASYTRPQIQQLYDQVRGYCLENSMAVRGDDGASRMVGNYAAVITAWRLLCEFTGIPKEQGGFISDVIMEMNTQVAETSADREPWVWIVETLLSEIEAGNFRHPYAWKDVDEEISLVIRASHVMDHLSHTMALRDKWNALPVKSARVFKRQIDRAEVVVSDRVDVTIKDKRYHHMVALGVERLAKYGLHATPDAHIEPYV